MTDRLDRIEARLRQVEEGLACALRRLDAAERPPLAGGIGATPALTAPRSRETVASAGRLPFVPLIGRTFIVLGGAYFLRALTDTGRVGVRGGVALGFTYAIAWFVIADRTGSRRRASSVVHGFAGALIGLPLLWEAAARFHVLTAPWSVLALGVWTSVALGVAWHRRLQALAAVGVLGAIATAFALVAETGSFAPFAGFLTLLALVTWWLSGAAGWPWLRWPAAAAVDLLVAGLLVRAGAAPPLETPSSALLAAMALMLGSLMAFAWEPLARRQRIDIFEIVQTACVIALGAIGTVSLAPRLDLSIWAAIVWLGSGALAYVASSAVIHHARAIALSGHYFAMVGFVLIVTGAWLLLPASSIDIWLAASALAYLWLGSRIVHPVLAVQGAVLAVLGSLHAGLLPYATAVWAIHAGVPARFPAWLALLVAACGMAPLLWLRRVREQVFASAARVLLALLFVCAGATIAASVVDGWLVSRTAGIAAASSTIVLSGVVTLLALASRSSRGREFAWLTYPVCVATALKLLLVDFSVSSATTMFLSLGAYGLALTMAATLMKGRDRVPDVDAGELPRD